MRIMFLFIALLVTPAFAGVTDDWNLLQEQVRDNTIDRTAAKSMITKLHSQLFSSYSSGTRRSTPVFPVKGYGPRSIGGNGGNGFQPSSYDFYDGNKHGGHPAHDLFIRDRNFDVMDDTTGKPVKIVAFEGGVVVGVNQHWEYPSLIRGGVYIWIYSPHNSRYYYYAHLEKALIAPGDIVNAGDTIGELGRTGKNAYPHRSPTHLHFMCLTYDKGKMTPVNTYGELVTSRVLTNKN